MTEDQIYFKFILESVLKICCFSVPACLLMLINIKSKPMRVLRNIIVPILAGIAFYYTAQFCYSQRAKVEPQTQTVIIVNKDTVVTNSSTVKITSKGHGNVITNIQAGRGSKQNSTIVIGDGNITTTIDTTYGE